MVNLSRLPGETERQYLWRVGVAIENGTAGITWEEATPYINKEWRDDESEYRTSSAYRKPVQYAIPFYEEVFSKEVAGDYSDTFQQQRDELHKLKQQFYDQRREYNKILTSEARQEHLFDELRKCAEDLSNTAPLSLNRQLVGFSENEAVICFADWHYGMVTDNIWNKYNTEICRKRVASVVEKISKVLAENKPRKTHILLLGDAAHGGIHTTARVASDENVCDQIMNVSELLAQAIDALSSFSQETVVYSTYGNHLRTIQKKSENIHSDNMEKLIPWWIKERFRGREDVTVFTSDFYEFIPLRVCNHNIVAVHGDLDNVKKIGVSLNTIFSKRHGGSVDYTISADKHHIESFESYGIENIIVGSLCGTDDYANEHRLYSEPNQTVMIFTEEDGKYAQYNLKPKKEMI